MTEFSSSAGQPDGAALPAEHPLGPAVPIPPKEKEAAHVGREPGHDGGGTIREDGPVDGGQDTGGGQRDDASGAGSDGSPDADRRESVLDPSAGASGHAAASIRDEQGTHSAGTVPAAFNGTGSPEDPEDDRHPEDAARLADSWDSGGAEN